MTKKRVRVQTKQLFNFRQIQTLVLVTKHAIPNFKNEYLLIYVCSRMHSSSVGKMYNSSVLQRCITNNYKTIRIHNYSLPHTSKLVKQLLSKMMSQYYQATTLCRFSSNQPSHIPLFFFF